MYYNFTMKNIGEMIKEIRQAKGLRSKYVYNGIMSRSMYYKFENGSSDVTLQHFLSIADRLNVSFNELESLTEYHDGYTENLHHLMTLHYNGRIDEMESFAKTLGSLSERTGYLFYQHLHHLANLLLAYSTGRSFSNYDIKVIKDYLFNSENWYYYEISLFTNALFIFDLDVIDVLYKRSASALTSGFKSDHDPFVLVANILSLQFQRNDINGISKYIKIIQKLPDSKDIIFSRFLKDFYTDLYLYLATGKQEDEANVELHLLYLEKIGLNAMATSHRALFDVVKKHRDTDSL